MGSNCDDSVVISRGSNCEALTCILSVFIFPKEVLSDCPSVYKSTYWFSIMLRSVEVNSILCNEDKLKSWNQRTLQSVQGLLDSTFWERLFVESQALILMRKA